MWGPYGTRERAPHGTSVVGVVSQTWDCIHMDGNPYAFRMIDWAASRGPPLQFRIQIR